MANTKVTTNVIADDAVGVAELSASGTASSSTFLRGDNAWEAVDTATIATTAPGSPTQGFLYKRVFIKWKLEKHLLYQDFIEQHNYV